MKFGVNLWSSLYANAPKIFTVIHLEDKQKENTQEESSGESK